MAVHFFKKQQTQTPHPKRKKQVSSLELTLKRIVNSSVLLQDTLDSHCYYILGYDPLAFGTIVLMRGIEDRIGRERVGVKYNYCIKYPLSSHTLW